ncbi:MAG TPA: peroxiredoxin-like family protein, partial [Burkholderiaceae bacterium]|nr:peroxiredoxin-like family protein [Burkholderiaceae bacterium]
LDAVTESVRTQAPAHVVATIDDANRQLADSKLAAHALRVGQRAPAFVLPDATGRSVDSKTLLARGPLVISFYRGAWCPYCNLELQAWQRQLAELQALGATLVAISPQTPDASLTLAEKHALAFAVLSDLGNRVARQFGIVFTLDAGMRQVLETFGVDLPAHNGDASFELPVPATFLVERDGTVGGAWVDVDHRRRAEPSVVLARLRERLAQA